MINTGEVPLLYLWLSLSRYICCIDDNHQVDTSAVFMTIIKSIPLLYLWLSSSRYLCCISDYHHVDTSAVFMTIIRSIPLLYLWLSSCRYLCSIDDNHQVDTSAVFMTSTWWLSSIQQRYRHDDSHKYNRGIDLMIVINTAEVSTYVYHYVDTSAVLMTIIKSIPLLYFWLSSCRYLCCIYDYH
jgi:hypothetical protein